MIALPVKIPAKRQDNYTVRSSSGITFKPCPLPKWVGQTGVKQLVLDDSTVLKLEKFNTFVDTHYHFSPSKGKHLPYPRSGFQPSTDVPKVVRILRGSKVNYVVDGSKVICFVSDVVDQNGRQMQLAFEKCQHFGVSVRITHYSRN